MHVYIYIYTYASMYMCIYVYMFMIMLCVLVHDWRFMLYLAEKGLVCLTCSTPSFFYGICPDIPIPTPRFSSWRVPSQPDWSI